MSVCALMLTAGAAVIAGVGAGPAAAQTVPLCHATGSLTTPYATIEADPAAHAGHPGDIVPAPPGGCPETLQAATPTPVPTLAPTPPAATVTICHATGGAGSEYVELTVRRDQLARYRNGRNLIPAPAGGCPARVAGRAPLTAAPAPALSPSIAVPPVSAPVASSGSGLPVTGWEIVPVALIGVGFLLSGGGLRILVGRAHR